MDRETTVRLSNMYLLGSMQEEDIKHLLLSYCIEKNKGEEESKIFINKILYLPILYDCIRIALEYYEKKFHVCKIYEVNKNQPFKKILKIF